MIDMPQGMGHDLHTPTKESKKMEKTIIGNCYDSSDIEATLIDAPLWWHERGLQKTASGYGKKIPTRHKVNYKGRLRRVYCDVFSNSGHCYIIVKGEKITVR